jgi:hypothetical protein
MFDLIVILAVILCTGLLLWWVIYKMGVATGGSHPDPVNPMPQTWWHNTTGSNSSYSHPGAPTDDSHRHQAASSDVSRGCEVNSSLDWSASMDTSCGSSSYDSSPSSSSYD